MSDLEKLLMNKEEYKVIEERWKKHVDYLTSKIHGLYSTLGNKALVDKFLDFYQQANGSLYAKVNDLLLQYGIDFYSSKFNITNSSKLQVLVQELLQELQIYENLKSKMNELTFSPTKKYNMNEIISKYITENKLKNFNILKEFPKLYVWFCQKNNLNAQEMKAGFEVYILKREQMYYSLFHLIELTLNLIREATKK